MTVKLLVDTSVTVKEIAMMRIGELAARTGVSRRSLRYYEEHGLLHAERSANGWRVYREAAVQRVRKIADLLDISSCAGIRVPRDAGNRY